jgi:hypothetical protein
MSDVSRLRELLAEKDARAKAWEAHRRDLGDGFCMGDWADAEELHEAAVNALPKLLDVVEAAKGIRRIEYKFQNEITREDFGDTREACALMDALASLEDPSPQA